MAVPYRVRDKPKPLNPYSYAKFLPGLFQKDEYSDLTICIQEVQTGEINLPCDDPALIRIMVHYMYGHGYRASKAKGLKSPATDPWLDLDIYALANKYDLEPLQQSAKNHFREWAEQAWSKPEFPSVAERIWDMGHLISIRHMIEEVIGDHAKDLCSPTGSAGDSLIKKGLEQKRFTEKFILRIVQVAEAASFQSGKNIANGTRFATTGEFWTTVC
ncbi:BTB/POZ domain protein [Penicillium cataractarum]|uniref:BTB/POZ domain protein n=1 Tax=Penicillium cataractarum TaxID=2100454 RepID=A0A9W9SGX0_9EURO|nr:BTB/POZ domain protein [Penicillium cataractarum]KAJ5378155.1 BTB/POZ domain protein [Penicillium cataractarum]